MRSLRDSVIAALTWCYACHSAMLGLSLLTEGRPAPSLPDTVLDRLPRVAWIADHNYWIWLACYVPAALLLWRRDRPAFLHFLYLGGVLSLVRGLCVGLTGLGPAHGPDVNAGMSNLFSAWLMAEPSLRYIIKYSTCPAPAISPVNVFVTAARVSFGRS